MLAPYIVDLTVALAQMGHFVALVTNGTVTKRFLEIANLPNHIQSRIFIKFSLHYLELKRLDLLETFVRNVTTIKESGCSFTIEMTVNDEMIPHIQAVKAFCCKHFGANCHVIESRDQTRSDLPRLTKLPVDEHLKTWDCFDSPIFQLQAETFEHKRTEFCYAGDWIINLFLENGDFYPCLGGGNRLGNLFEFPDEPLHPAAVGANCPWPHCYPAHVCLTSGAIPSLQTPCYAQMRNRVCPDGSEWLKPTVKDFFSKQFRDCQPEYSAEKRAYLDALMQLEYPSSGSPASAFSGHALKDTFRKQGWKRLAVYGKGGRESFLLEILQQADMHVSFLVDSSFQLDSSAVGLFTRIKRVVKYSLKRLLSGQTAVLLNRYDHWPRVDAVIVLDYSNFDRIKHALPPEKAACLVPLTELVKH